MTRKEFLEFASKQNYYSNKELAKYNIENLREKLGSNSDFIFDFLYRNGFNGDLSIEPRPNKANTVPNMHCRNC